MPSAGITVLWITPLNQLSVAPGLAFLNSQSQLSAPSYPTSRCYRLDAERRKLLARELCWVCIPGSSDSYPQLPGDGALCFSTGFANPLYRLTTFFLPELSWSWRQERCNSTSHSIRKHEWTKKTKVILGFICTLDAIRKLDVSDTCFYSITISPWFYAQVLKVLGKRRAARRPLLTVWEQLTVLHLSSWGQEWFSASAVQFTHSSPQDPTAARGNAALQRDRSCLLHR